MVDNFVITSAAAPFDISAATQHSILLHEESNRHIFVFDENWPTHTHEICLYDLHPFQTQPYGIPTSFEPRTKKYCVYGFFCSPECAHAYLKRQNQKSSSSGGNRTRLDIFHRFYANVLNVRNVGLPPPLELLSKYYADQGSSNNKRSANGDLKKNLLPSPIELWRNESAMYEDMREINGGNLYVRVASVYEMQTQKRRQRMRHDRHAELMRTQKPKPLVMTEVGQKQQIEYVKQVVSGKIKAGRKPAMSGANNNHNGGGADEPSAIDSMMGIKLVRKK